MTKTAEKTSIPAKPLCSGSKVAGFKDNQISVVDTETAIKTTNCNAAETTDNGDKYMVIRAAETYTEQQIEDFIRWCEEGDIGPAYPAVLCKSVQIIKQQQAEKTLAGLFGTPESKRAANAK